MMIPCSCVICEPDKYKVCQGCESIAFADEALCPHCKAYKFDYRAESVVSQYKIINHPDHVRRTPIYDF